MLANAMVQVSKDRQPSTAFMRADKYFCNKTGKSLGHSCLHLSWGRSQISIKGELREQIKKVRSSLSVPKPALGVGLGVFLPAPVLLVLLVYR